MLKGPRWILGRLRMNEKSIDRPWEAPSERLYAPQVLLAFMPPSQEQRRVALAIVLILFIVFIVTAPFVYYPLPQVNAFIPAFDTAVFICDLITATLDDKLPNVRCNRVQLQQVILNLITNAVDAMNSVTSRQRVLRLRSALSAVGQKRT